MVPVATAAGSGAASSCFSSACASDSSGTLSSSVRALFRASWILS